MTQNNTNMLYSIIELNLFKNENNIKCLRIVLILLYTLVEHMGEQRPWMK